MRDVLTMISRVVIAAPKRVLLTVMLLTVAAAIFGANVAEHLGAGGFQDPDSPSARGMKVLTEKFGVGNMDLTLVVRSPDGVLDPTAAAAGRRLVEKVQSAPHISGVVSPWDESARTEGLVSKDGTSALVIAGISGGENNAPKYTKAVADQVSGERDGLIVLAGGTAMVASEINEQSEKDLLSAELIALPLSLIALIWVFGGLFAALLPLTVGVMAIIGTLGMIRGITLFTDVSIFALDLTTAMGLALAIDYTLLLVSRYREEHAADRRSGRSIAPGDGDSRSHDHVLGVHGVPRGGRTRGVPDVFPAFDGVRRLRGGGPRRAVRNHRGPRGDQAPR